MRNHSGEAEYQACPGVLNTGCMTGVEHQVTKKRGGLLRVRDVLFDRPEFAAGDPQPGGDRSEVAVVLEKDPYPVPSRLLPMRPGPPERWPALRRAFGLPSPVPEHQGWSLCKHRLDWVQDIAEWYAIPCQCLPFADAHILPQITEE
jgi:hypothetical protein